MRGELTEGLGLPLREPLPLPIRFSHGSRAVVAEGYSTGCDTCHGATRGVLLNYSCDSGRLCLADLTLTICYLPVDRLRA